MPARNESGALDPGPNGDYYCDANQVGGTFCPEFDIMEANKYSWRTTAHTCDDPKLGHYINCDKKGQGHDKDDWGKDKFGPGSKINTNEPIHVQIKYCIKRGG